MSDNYNPIWISIAHVVCATVMKILYSAGNRSGADIQLFRFLKYYSGDIKIAAYVKSSQSLTHVDWTLDALDNDLVVKTYSYLTFGHKQAPPVSTEELKILIQDVKEYAPDLIICDMEPIMSHIAKTLNIRLWYCSPIHLQDGVLWEKGQKRYAASMENIRIYLSRMPEAERILVYSPFCDVVNRPKLREKYEWVSPYYFQVPHAGQEENVAIINDDSRISELSRLLNCLYSFQLRLFSRFSHNLSNIDSASISDEESCKEILKEGGWLFTTGETSFVADAFYNGIKICISPNLKDPETLLNAMMLRIYKIGDDVAQIERMKSFAVEEMVKSISNKNNRQDYININGHKKLHELIGEI